jgi:hypothetical protein
VRPKRCPFCKNTPVVLPIDWKAEGDAWAAVSCENDHCEVKPQLKNWADIVASGAKGHAEQKRIVIKKWNDLLED